MPVIKSNFTVYGHQSHHIAYEGLGPHLQHRILNSDVVVAFWCTAMNYYVYLFS